MSPEDRLRRIHELSGDGPKFALSELPVINPEVADMMKAARIRPLWHILEETRSGLRCIEIPSRVDSRMSSAPETRIHAMPPTVTEGAAAVARMSPICAAYRRAGSNHDFLEWAVVIPTRDRLSYPGVGADGSVVAINPEQVVYAVPLAAAVIPEK